MGWLESMVYVAIATGIFVVGFGGLAAYLDWWSLPGLRPALDRPRPRRAGVPRG